VVDEVPMLPEATPEGAEMAPAGDEPVPDDAGGETTEDDGSGS
jgi:hypothetical protein